MAADGCFARIPWVLRSSLGRVKLIRYVVDRYSIGRMEGRYGQGSWIGLVSSQGSIEVGMKLLTCRNWIIGLIGCVVVLFSLGLSRHAIADEPAEAFLEGLQEIGYFDVALDYLDQSANDPFVPESFRKKIDYYRAETLIESIAGARDAKLTNARLDQAQKLLERYSKSGLALQDRAQVLERSGTLYSARADLVFRKASSDRLTVGEREQLMVQARGLLQNATSSIQKSLQLLARLIDPDSDDAIRIDPDDPSTKRLLEDLRRTYTLVGRKLPAMMERTGDTYPETDDARKAEYAGAIEYYNKIWDKYRQRYSVGSQARVDAARCYKKLGNHKKALELLGDVFSLSNAGRLKQIKKDAYVLAADCWSKTEPYPFKDIVYVLDAPVKGLSRGELRDQGWLRVQLELAIAKHASATELAKSKKPRAASEAKAVDRAAGKLVRNVARVPNPLRDRAKALLSEWNMPLVDASEDSVKIASFADALESAREGVAELEAVASEHAKLKQQQAGGADQATRDQLATQIKPLEEQIQSISEKTLGLLSQAMGFVDDQTPVAEINNVRYLQCYVMFASGKNFEAVALADHLLTHYPSEPVSKQASNFLISGLATMFANAMDGGQFEYEMLKEKCDLVMELFPGSSEAGAAGSKLCAAALRDKDQKAAKFYFQKIPEDYPGRDRLGLRVGQVIWMDYKRMVREKQDPATAQAKLSEASQLMEQSAKTLGPKDVTYDAAVGGLMLVEAKLRLGKNAEALRYLDSPEASVVAPLHLIRKQHPAVSAAATSEIFRREAYKIAIKTYLAAMRSDPANRKQWVDKANGIIDHMKQIVEQSKDPNARKRVTAVYQLIASELREGFDEIEDVQEKLSYAKSLEDFLVSIQKNASDPMTLLWAGTTMYSVADVLDKSGKLERSRPMMKQAVATLDRAEDLGIDGSQNASLKIQLIRYRALARRGAGEYEQAVDDFIKLLSSQRVPVSYQIDAAQTLQEWGIRKNDKTAISKATNGTGVYTNPKTGKKAKAIWGWIQMRSATMTDPKYRDIFYTALYGIVEGRYEYGKMASSKKAIASALREIEKERSRRPDFSGMAIWKKKFDALERKIRASQ